MSVESTSARKRALGHHPESPDHQAFIAAADRIEALEAALRKIAMKENCAEIGDYNIADLEVGRDLMIKIARSALTKKEVHK